MGRLFKQYRGLPQGVYIITLARFINRIGFFVFAFLTLFLTKKLGFSVSEAGQYVMYCGVAQIPGVLIGGHLSDRFGRKKVLVIAQSLAATLLLPCAFLGDSMLVPYLLIVSCGINALAVAPMNAMMADLTTPENRKQSYSFLYLGANLGIAIGTFLAGILFYSYTEWLFIGDFLTTAFSMIFIIKYIKETKPSQEEVNEMKEDSLERSEEGGLVAVLARRPLLVCFVLTMTIYSFIYAQSSLALPLQVTDVFGDRLGSKLYGIIMPVNAIIVVFATPLLTKSTKQIKSAINMSMGGYLYAIGFGMLFFTNTFTMFAISTVIWTLGEILIAINGGVYIANHTPISHRGRVSSVFPLVTGAGRVISMDVMSELIEVYNLRWVWKALFILGIIGGSIMIVIYFIEVLQNKRLQKDI